jgi:halimadienyl-diphosphate synthase
LEALDVRSSVAHAAWWEPLLPGLGDSAMDPVAYDTAWVARVPDPTGRNLLVPAAWDWLCANQHADGSWGAGSEFLPDRIAATLAAVVALAANERAGLRKPPAGAIAAGLRYVGKAAVRWAAGPSEVETVGFELCVPALLSEARRLELKVPETLAPLAQRRAAKLARLPEGWRRRPPKSLVHSLEAWAEGELPPDLVDASGSCANSPSATAYHHMRAPTRATERYLRGATSRGGATDVDPFEVFELAWSLDHLAHAGVSLRDPRLRPALDRLQAGWRDGEGAGISAVGLEPDADDTALAAVTLDRGGRRVSAEVLRAFEREAGFATFPFERDPSCSANIHVAYAVSRLPFRGRFDTLCKVLGFLADSMHADGYWTDKWHLSPFYPTCRAVIALHRIAPDLVEPAVHWLRRSQHASGAFGTSPEETAYAVQALAAAGIEDGRAFRRAGAYLRECSDRPPLWIGKGLYCPRRVVDVAVASAQAIARRWAI